MKPAITMFCLSLLVASTQARAQQAGPAESAPLPEDSTSDSSNSQTVVIPPAAAVPGNPRRITFDATKSGPSAQVFGAAPDSHLTTGMVSYEQHMRVPGKIFGGNGKVFKGDCYYVMSAGVVEFTQDSDNNGWGRKLGPGKTAVVGGEVSPWGYKCLWGKPGRVQAVGGIHALMYGLNKTLYDKYGSHLDYGFRMEAGLRYQVTKNTAAELSYNFFHASNGATAPSNLGGDFHGPGLGLVYTIPPSDSHPRTPWTLFRKVKIKIPPSETPPGVVAAGPVPPPAD